MLCDNSKNEILYDIIKTRDFNTLELETYGTYQII